MTAGQTQDNGSDSDLDPGLGLNAATKKLSQTVISVDAMGGEQGPAAIVGGVAVSAGQYPDVRFILHGDETLLRPLLAKRKKLASVCEVRNWDRTVAMDEKPSHVMRKGKGTSMWGTIDSVRDSEASVAVSCGNTGALMAVSMIRLRKLPGISRPAIGILWPSDNAQGFNVMLDVGADVKAEPQDLLQYSLMGASYARNGLGLAKPRIGLLNVGTEENKGRSGLKEAFDLIQETAEPNGFDFVGFVEGSDIPSDRVDVIVTDGFTGNIALKTAEGTASFVRRIIFAAFQHTLLSRIGALFAVTSLRRLSKRIDPRRVNGGVFLGLNGTVIKSHGDADAIGVTAAINLAIQLANSQFAEKLAARVASNAPKGEYADDGANKDAANE
ncbi:MAG: glycerol-3-phosphate acyltransferase PlsX [Paracoccaceae bacterium]|jgi:glycerol-3-phosphate acyltransferase PlsX